MFKEGCKTEFRGCRRAMSFAWTGADWETVSGLDPIGLLIACDLGGVVWICFCAIDGAGVF